MAYAAWSVSFGEQPSTAKWNILGTNDASFNNGTGIANLATNVTSISNPYKFHVYRNAAANTGNGAFAKVTFDTETFDTNNNFATGTYTAPVAGFYQLSYTVSVVATGSGTDIAASLYKNGSEFKRGSQVTSGGAFNYALSASMIIQSAASDTWEVYAYAGTTKALSVGSASTFFSGVLISQT